MLRVGECTAAPRCQGRPSFALSNPSFDSLIFFFFFFSRESNLYFTCRTVVWRVRTALAGLMGTVACFSLGKNPSEPLFLVKIHFGVF